MPKHYQGRYGLQTHWTEEDVRTAWAELVGTGVKRVQGNVQEAWERERAEEMAQARELGISPDALRMTFLTDYLAGWKDTDWMNGSLRNEVWRAQLNRPLTEGESSRLEQDFMADRSAFTLQRFLRLIPSDVLVIRCRELGQN